MPSCHSVHDLELAVQDLWAHLPQNHIRCLKNSMQDRLAVGKRRENTSHLHDSKARLSTVCRISTERGEKRVPLRIYKD
ncbi:hypothetical protein TNCV_384431 [Trichonephila clavipes]|nr:hypothetical protein TNCV_384431 [Trichonephila clavipes]